MNNATSTRLLITLLGSLALHAVVFLSWPQTANLPQAGGEHDTLAVVVLASQAKSVNNPARPATAPAEQVIIKSKKPLQPGKTPAKKTTTTTVTVENTDVAQTTVEQTQVTTRAGENTSSTHEQQASLEEALRKAFNAQFYYPRMAIRRGWQGEVQLGLRIESDGHLTRVRIIRSSGYGVLDNAAMNSLNKVGFIPGSVALLNGHSLDLVLPVEYRLL